MSVQCDKCGSPNHKEWDCSKPYNGWKELEPAQTLRSAPTAPIPLPDRKTAPNRAPEAGNSGKKVQLDPKTGRDEHGRSGPLPKRANFPFLRECTRRAIDERIERMTSGRVGALKARVDTREQRERVNLPKKVHKQQGGLF